MDKLRISISGASGLLGTFIVQHFYAKGHVLYCHRNQSSIPQELQDLNIKWIQGDIRDQFVVNQLVNCCDVFIHTAAMVSFSASMIDHMMSVNIEGTRLVVDHCIGKNVRLIHISSIAALGRVDEGVAIDEDVHFNINGENSAYAQSKYLSEMEVHRGIAEGVEAMILSPSIILGSNERNSSSATIWNQILKFPKLAPKGANGFVDVRDVVQGIEKALINWRNGEKYIINGHNLSYVELYMKVLQHRSIKVRPSPINPIILKAMLPFVKLVFFMLRISSKISLDAINSTSKTYRYKNIKSRTELGLTYKEIEESIAYFL